MDLRFNLEYHTAFGEALVLNVVSSDSEGEKMTNSYKMTTIDGRNWSCDVNSLLKVGTSLDYFYTVTRDGVEVRREWTLETHRLELAARKATRYQSITVEYRDETWQKRRQNYSGWIAQIIQHELDHLEGIVI